MKTVSMVDFRLNAERILALVQKGQRVTITRRGKPVARLEPIQDLEPSSDDPIYSLAELSEKGGSLTNQEINEILYGK